MKIDTLLIAYSLALTLPAATARGVMFEDRDGEPGVADVRVSNGLDVVLTGADGTYALPIDGDAVIFITKPAGYATPVDMRQLPRFYYIHQPGGSPEGLRYTGLAPTGPLPPQINFPLRRVDEPSAFTTILFADPQPQTTAELDYIRDDVITPLIGTEARFGMTMGDILFDDLTMFPRYNALIAQLGIPWYNVPGNHDMNLQATDDRHALETFKRHFGPPYYAFEVGSALFVVLDNIFYRGSGQSDPGDVRGDGGYEARLTERQLVWLATELAHVPPHKLIVLAMHAPLKSAAGNNTVNRRDLLQLLEGRSNLYAVAGHTHSTEHHYLGKEDGFPGPRALHHHVLTTVSGSWWSGPFDERGIAVAEQWDGTPNGYHLLDIDGTELSVRYRAASKPADYQMRISLDVTHHGLGAGGLRDFRMGEQFDGRMAKAQVEAAQVIVNLFDGGPRSAVALAIDNRPYTQMEHSRRVDPHTNELFIRNPETRKPWVKAQPSTHLWSADLPNDLAAGTHTLTVHAVDEFGRVHHGHRILEISE